MPELVQDVVVTIAALGAAWILVRRVFGVFGPARGASSGCPSCASGEGGCGHTGASTTTATPAAAPLTLHRAGSSGRKSQVSSHKP